MFKVAATSALMLMTVAMSTAQVTFTNDGSHLAHAMQICFAHEHGNQFDHGWENDCTAIFRKWTDHARAAQDEATKQQAAQDAKDKEFIHSMAKP